MSGTSILGAGLRFPLQIDPETGGFLRASEADAVARSIWCILSTAPGEREMRPEFGCDIHDLLLAPGDPGTFGRVAREVNLALARWEPRVEVLAVLPRRADDGSNTLDVEIQYRLVSTNSRYNMVYPLYLDGGGP